MKKRRNAYAIQLIMGVDLQYVGLNKDIPVSPSRVDAVGITHSLKPSLEAEVHV